MQGPHLAQQLTHILRTRTGSRLIRHGRHPLDQIVREQTAETHEHQRDRAVAADPVLAALGQRCLDDVEIDRIEDDHRILVHPQR